MLLITSVIKQLYSVWLLHLQQLFCRLEHGSVEVCLVDNGNWPLSAWNWSSRQQCYFLMNRQQDWTQVQRIRSWTYCTGKILIPLFTTYTNRGMGKGETREETAPIFSFLLHAFFLLRRPSLSFCLFCLLPLGEDWCESWSSPISFCISLLIASQ